MTSIRIDTPSASLSETLFVGPSSGEGSALFETGEVLDGRVIEWIDDHHAVLQLNGQDHSVQSQFLLPRDLEGRFRVEATWPQVVLKWIPDQEENYALSGTQQRQYLPNEGENALIIDLGTALSELGEIGNGEIPFPVQTSLKHLLTLLEQFSIPTSSSLTPEQTEEMVLRSGLFFEARLKTLIESCPKDQEAPYVAGDLKGLMIQLKSQVEVLSSSSGLSKELSSILGGTERGLDGILRKMEGYQFINLPSPDSDGKYFLLLPIWFQNGLRFVEMALSLPRRDSEGRGQGGISILFLLDLPEWGKMSIAVTVKEKALYCHFTVPDQHVSELLGRHISELSARLVGLGFAPQLGISMDSQEEMTRKFLEEIGGNRDPLLDCVV